MAANLRAARPEASARELVTAAVGYWPPVAIIRNRGTLTCIPL